MRGKKNEIEALESGLALAKDPYQLAELLTQSKESLAAYVSQRIRYTALDMADQGRYFHAIKKLCGHTGWEPFVDEQTWNWEYVRCCMKLTEVAAWLPQILNIPPGRIIQTLMHLPKPEIKELLDDLSPEETSKLTLWELKRLHGRIPKKPARARKDIEIPEIDHDLNKLFLTAHQALLDIAECSITKKQKELAHKLLRRLSHDWERAAYNLGDPEHKTTPRWEMNPHERALDGLEEEEGAAL